MDTRRARKWNGNQLRDTARTQTQEDVEMYQFITKILTKMKIVSQKGY